LIKIVVTEKKTEYLKMQNHGDHRLAKSAKNIMLIVSEITSGKNGVLIVNTRSD
jgi:hypothetical protein